MNTNKIAKEIKDYLVNLAVNDKLPLDMTNLPVIDIQAIIEKNLPTERQRIIEAAGHYLSGCSNDDEIAEMVELIAKFEDETQIIDYIDGVIVWDKVEYSFTCEQFLEEIGFNDDFYKK